MGVVYGLVGRQLGHSLSAEWFTGEFARRGLDGYRYLIFPLEDISLLGDMLKDNPELRGFNVTIPYKEAIIPLLDRLDAVASEVGAVNCVKVEEGGFIGYNTDVYGFDTALSALAGHDLPPRALIFGTGGAAKAAGYALRQRGIDYRMVSRAPGGNAMGYEELTSEVLKEHLLLVNATPLGMFPDRRSCPAIPYEALTRRHLLLDMVYNPVETVFMANGRQCGARVANGLAMLHAQAARSLEIWMAR